MNGVLALEVSDASGVGAAARTASAETLRAGCGETTAARAAIVATELASNLVKHAHGGVLLVRRLSPPDTPGVEFVALDDGPGIRDVGESLRDGYSTAGSPGTGLGAVRRLSAVFEIHAPPGGGTAVLSRVVTGSAKPSPPTGVLTVGALALPRRDETACGDAWAASQTGERAVFLVVDGLGHGEMAAQAAALAVSVFRSRVADTPVELVTALDAALRSTRGAALAVAEVLPGEALVTYAGLGNISARIYGGDDVRSLVSTEGTAGAAAGRARAYTYAWPAGGTLVMHSDGVTRHWDLDDRPGLRGRHPSLIAAVLLRDARRQRDDATVLVAAPLRTAA